MSLTIYQMILKTNELGFTQTPLVIFCCQYRPIAEVVGKLAFDELEKSYQCSSFCFYYVGNNVRDIPDSNLSCLIVRVSCRFTRSANPKACLFVGGGCAERQKNKIKWIIHLSVWTEPSSMMKTGVNRAILC